MTVPGVEIVDGPVYAVNTVPAGTPVLDASGNAPGGGGGGCVTGQPTESTWVPAGVFGHWSELSGTPSPSASVGGGGGVAAETVNVLLASANRPSESVTRRTTVLEPVD